MFPMLTFRSKYPEDAVIQPRGSAMLVKQTSEHQALWKHYRDVGTFSVSLCVCVGLCACTYTSTCVHKQRLEGMLIYWYLKRHPPCFLRLGSSLSWSSSVGLGWPNSKPQGLIPDSSFLVQEYICVTSCQALVHGFWGSTLIPHICPVVTLPTKPPP